MDHGWGAAGIDAHKHTFTVGVINVRSGRQGIAAFDMTEEGFAEALAWLDGLGL